ncbi:hypothetical protein QTI17_28030 [Variovorax sp. J31P179]|uniref:hypothetical protein n=1 Tax=Variovorax sp. J31P179 TaxID=3053508 RepID=UPI002575FECC|nr:hypothetical protein [Variovorax sp. J31P179]MDM0084457.1 hypothetical protein [Variovorax sp. J31P179]
MGASFLSLVPPGSGGVRDYASVIGQSLQAPPFEMTRTTDISSLSGDCLLLHFSGYGYHKRGVPLWLVEQVRRLRSRFQAFGVVFHELYASSPPWGSAFWLGAWQKRIARELLDLSDFWLTNREESGRWLLARRGAAPHRVLPVFSNVGEPASIDADRAPHLVVFGGPGVRANVYQWAGGEVFDCARRRGLVIHDIGPPLQDAQLAQRLVQEKAVVHGKLSAQAVSQALSGASYGALSYPLDYASKSGVLAAYSAHGLCPILLWEDYRPHDGLVANFNYLPGFAALENVDARTVGRQARQWYEPHCVDAHVAALRAMRSEATR